MNITLLTPKFQSRTIGAQNSSYNNTVRSTNLSGLQADTVSFSGARPDRIAKKAGYTMLDVFGTSYENALDSHSVIAKKFINAVADAAENTEGVDEFDKKAMMETVLKSKKSYISKLKRSCSIPMDQIRTTITIRDIYDLSILNKFLKNLHENGFDLLPLEREGGKKSGAVTRYDFDIRMDDVPREQLRHLPELLRDSVSGSVPAGLKDIQMRVVETDAKHQIPLEILVMVGKESVKAKKIEEDDVYNFIRVLKDELNISKQNVTEADSPIRKFKDYVRVVADTLRGGISRPMYANAEAIDVTGESLGLPVGINKQTATVLRGFLESLRSNILAHYNDGINRVNSKDYEKEIEKLIRASADYKERADKTIYIDDIIAKRNELVDELRDHRDNDMETFLDVHAGLKRTIAKYTFKDK